MVSPGTFPNFNPAHSYRFVVDLGSTVGHLTFGNFDCGFFDNTKLHLTED